MISEKRTNIRTQSKSSPSVIILFVVLFFVSSLVESESKRQPYKGNQLSTIIAAALPPTSSSITNKIPNIVDNSMIEEEIVNNSGRTSTKSKSSSISSATRLMTTTSTAAGTTSAADLQFGDRIIGRGERRESAASNDSVCVDHDENALNLPLHIQGSLEKPSPLLLAEGSDFRFEFISQCELPTDRGLFNLRAYRYTKHGKQVEPVVLFQGDHYGQKDVLVRVHDQCLTSEVLGSRRCDCKEQLELALDRIVAGDGGLIVYLPQEGRGIGLANKVAAYALQEQGLDTVDANLMLGFGGDERTYDYVGYILKDFGIESIRLATNNPFKARSLRSKGVEISSIEPIQAPPNPHNLHYLRTKTLKMEHALDLSLTFSPSASDITSTATVTATETLTDSDRNSTSSLEKDDLGAGYDLEEEEEEELAKKKGQGYCFGKETVEAAIRAIAEGKMVVVVDDEDRENEGDIIMAADAVTTEAMAFIVRHTSGVVCVSMEGKDLDRLALPPMLAQNEDPKRTAFTVSVDYKYNTTTGISAHDRALTLRMLADKNSRAEDFTRPGHLFPLRYRPGGVKSRRGHTEAALDLARLAGRAAAGVLCEICSEDGSMARLPELQEFIKKHNLVLTSIADLVAYREEMEL